jgi:hypothetical protein
MTRTAQPKSTGIATKEGREFVRLVLSLGVGIAVGLAPFLGNLQVPGFVPLLSLFPRSLRGVIVPLSAFLMGIVAVMVQYSTSFPRTKRATERIFRRAYWLLICSFLALIVFYFFIVVQVPVPGNHSAEAVVVGFVRLDSCHCAKDSSALQCVENLSLFPGAIESCWGSVQVNASKLLLCLFYLAATGSFGAIIGLIVLRSTNRTPSARSIKTKKPLTTARRGPVDNSRE